MEAKNGENRFKAGLLFLPQDWWFGLMNSVPDRSPVGQFVPAEASRSSQIVSQAIEFLAGGILLPEFHQREDEVRATANLSGITRIFGQHLAGFVVPAVGIKCQAE